MPEAPRLAATRPGVWLGVSLVLSMLTALALGTAWACRNNTLYHNGQWVSTKAQLGRYTMGAVAFMVTPTALHYNRLNLGVWHGFQEVVYRQPLTLEHVSFDCLLPDETWVTLIFNKTENGFDGLRISRVATDPTEMVQSAPNGRFVRYIPLPMTGRAGWNHVDMARRGRHWELSINGQTAEVMAWPMVRGGCGFRGCLGQSAVDNVVLVGDEGSYRDSFDNRLAPRTWCSLLAIALAISVGLTMGFRGPLLVTMHFWGLVTALVLLGVQWFYYGPMHPKTIDYTRFPDYRNFVDAAPGAWDICTDLQNRYGNVPFKGRRVMFVGSSQTWGSGAATDDETWVKVLERRLHPVVGPLQCINTGISGLASKDLLLHYQTQWLPLHPQVTVIDLAFNDSDAGPLVSNVAHMLDAGDRQGVKPLLILEPNCPQYHDPKMPTKRAALQALAEQRHVPYIDMESYLTQHEGDGFVWWDMVHLTGFGQQLFADRVYPDLLKLLQ